MTPSRSRRSLLQALGALAVAPLAGCGFQLRGPRPLAFSTLHVNVGAQNEFGAALRRRIRTSGTTEVVDDPSQAEAKLEILRNQPEREILTLTGAGKVREYELRHVLTFRLVDRAGTERIRPTTISAKREYTYDDSQVLAKEQEEALLYRDMRGDLVDQLMRRLAAVKP
ncbi:LPS-assembly lipoprotein LptE [Aromatoleum toluclasticum]|uniref:LPS-assembly lipoprotein LptE n=1 Tax=Aromatoleum toluclasticum TaxID=92003 RepID=UPI00035C4DAC|nr:LPS assembly lipoprotein LptE [Aromatoleum toluclasticum]